MGNARQHGWASTALQLEKSELIHGDTVWSADWMSAPDRPAGPAHDSGSIDLRALTLRYQQELAGAPVDPRRHCTVSPVPEPVTRAPAAVAVAAGAAVVGLVLLSVTAVVLLSGEGSMASSSLSATLHDAPGALPAGVVDSPQQAAAIETIPSATVHVFEDAARLEAANSPQPRADRSPRTRPAKQVKRRKRRAKRGSRLVARDGAELSPVLITPEESVPAHLAPVPEPIVVAEIEPMVPEQEPATPTCNEIECALDPSLSCCPKAEPVTKSRALPDRPSAAGVREQLARMKGRLSSCGDKHATGLAIIIAFSIAPDGSVRSLSVPDASDALAGCLHRALSRANFPASRMGLSMRYPLSFRRY